MPTSENTAKKSKAMSKKLLQHFEKRLMEERRRAVKELGSYGEAFGATSQESDGDLSSYSFHMADQGSLPLAHRRGTASPVPLAGDVRQVPQLRKRHRVRAAGRAAACALLHLMQAARGRCEVEVTLHCSGRFSS